MIVTINIICVTSIQLRLLPRVDKVMPSNKGAHRNFSEYGNPTRANSPIVDLDIPSSVNQACKRVIVSSKGIPDTKPIDNVMNIFF